MAQTPQTPPESAPTPSPAPTRPSLGDYVRPSKNPPPVKGAAATSRVRRPERPERAERPERSASAEKTFSQQLEKEQQGRKTPTASETKETAQAAQAAQALEKEIGDAVGSTTPEEAEARLRKQVYDGLLSDLEPVIDYQKFLAQEGISEETAADIVDDLLFKGYYEERISLTRRSTVVFRTRSQTDVLRMQTAIEVQRPTYEAALNELVVRYNMASSLVSLRDLEFEFPDEKATKERAEELFDIRLNFIETLAAPLFSKLSLKLARFDRKVVATMREGVAENF